MRHGVDPYLGLDEIGSPSPYLLGFSVGACK